MNAEPSRIITLITGAVSATVGLLALLLNWSADLVATLGIVTGAWIAVAGEIIRSKVTPNGNVKLTQEEYAALVAAGYSPGKRKLNPEGDLDAR